MYLGFTTSVTEYRDLPALGTANFGLIDFGQSTFPVYPALRVGFGNQVNYLALTPLVKRSTGSSAFLCDYIALFPHPLHVRNSAGASGAQTILVLSGDRAHAGGGTWSVGRSTLLAMQPLITNGYPMLFEGGKLNFVNLAMGEVNASDTAPITWTLTVNELWLTIRNQIG
jgi:hypothetical protein